MGRDTREAAGELRSVAPLVVIGSPHQLVGPCTLVTNGARTVAFSSAELLRQAGEPLGIAVTNDGSKVVRVASWMMGRLPGIGIIELAEPLPRGIDIVPLQLGAVMATVDTRGMPAGIVTVAPHGSAFERRVIPVHVDMLDGNGMSDEITRLATPDDAADNGASIDGAALFAWFAADPVLGRESEVVAVALAIPYRAQLYKPRANPPVAELIGLEDLGRALPWAAEKQEGSNDLSQVAGEIREVPVANDPLAGLDSDE
ncbi:MAG: hypothetical protein JO257_02235 [Deltaproteobacteria bacterium]|nr:hypothetical protein [Deltaproteobacteria bacterium]